MEKNFDAKVEEWAILFREFGEKLISYQDDKENKKVTPETHGKKLANIAQGRTTCDGEPIGSYCAARDLDQYLYSNQLPLTGIGRILANMILDCPESVEGIVAYTDNVTPSGLLDTVNKRCKLIWTSKLPTVTDIVLTEIVPVKATVIPAITRDIDPNSPEYQLVISLPWWVLATDYERMQALHYGFCHFGRNAGKPVLRKHDIKQFSANLARYGLRDPREAQAYFAAKIHVDTEDRVNMWLPTGRARIATTWPSKSQPADERDRYQLSLFETEEDKEKAEELKYRREVEEDEEEGDLEEDSRVEGVWDDLLTRKEKAALKKAAETGAAE